MQDFENLDFYELLGVERIASADEIKRAYRQQIMRYHPDRFVGASPEEQEYARQRAQRINEAYAALSNFAARSAYNRGQAAPQVRTAAPVATPPEPPATRDHQAELYNQARAHLDGGRYLQAIALLRQLQQVNPFYRDSAALLADAEARARPARPAVRSEPTAPRPEPVAQAPARQAAQEPATPPPTRSIRSSEEQMPASPTRRRWLIGGAVGAVALALLGAATVGLRGRTTGTGGTTGTEGTSATSVAGADVATQASTVVVPTTEATVVPTAIPMTKTTAPSPVPSATPLPENTAVPTIAVEQGTMLVADNFDNGVGWASLQSQLWSVGYARGKYQISVEPGAGNIWSYRTVPDGSNYTVGVDVTVQGGSGGLLVRYLDRANYVVYLVSPSQNTYRLEQHSAGRTIILAQDTSSAIKGGDGTANRLVARVQDNTVTLFINGTQVAEQTIPRLPQTRQYGLVAAADDVSTQALFDNLEVRDLEGGA